jgi:hypothetical protein
MKMRREIFAIQYTTALQLKKEIGEIGMQVCKAVQKSELGTFLGSRDAEIEYFNIFKIKLLFYFSF